jgi:monoamine oxidase
MTGRTPAFRRLQRWWQLALSPNPIDRGRRRSTPDALRSAANHRSISRREFVALGASALAAAPCTALASPAPRTLDVGIVGAGLAGLACADRLAALGLEPVVYDGADRVGGRCFSLRGFFPGQVAERGGEFIDNPHKTMLAYAKRFGLAREDVTKFPGETTYYFGGEHVAESAIVEQFRDFVPAMRADLRRLSNGPTAGTHTPADEELDHVSLAEYLDSRGASPLARAAIGAAYLAEYGRALDEQSCLNFLLFIHADRRTKFTPFGVFSDERWHLVNGNDGVALGLAAALPRGVEFGCGLVGVARRSDGRIELTFDRAGQSIVRVHQAVVLAIPFSVLQLVDLAPSLALPSWKLDAIHNLGYGINAKMMVGFDGRPWAPASTGSSYSDLAHHQTTWETNPALAADTRAVLTDYSSGARAAALLTGNVQLEATRFLTDLDAVYPGAFTAATRDAGGNVRVHLEHWPSNPFVRGSYTCYAPGQFTRIAGNEGTPIGNLFFAGEHTNSFYDWQGFMEGAAISGLDAAAAVTAK